MTAASARDGTGRPLTGRAVLLIALAAFGVIIAVNVALAVFAVRTFSGLVVPNSYVASQTFDHDRAAQIALGWELSLSHDGQVLRIDIHDAGGTVVRPETLRVEVGRPATPPADVSGALVETPGGYAAPYPLAPGDWRVEIDAATADGVHFRQRRVLRVPAT